MHPVRKAVHLLVQSRSRVPLSCSYPFVCPAGFLYRNKSKAQQVPSPGVGAAGAAQHAQHYYPELVGKLTPTGRVQPTTIGGLFKIFDALRRIAGDEQRMIQVREGRLCDAGLWGRLHETSMMQAQASRPRDTGAC